MPSVEPTKKKGGGKGKEQRKKRWSHGALTWNPPENLSFSGPGESPGLSNIPFWSSLPGQRAAEEKAGEGGGTHRTTLCVGQLWRRPRKQAASERLAPGAEEADVILSPSAPHHPTPQQRKPDTPVLEAGRERAGHSPRGSCSNTGQPAHLPRGSFHLSNAPPTQSKGSPNLAGQPAALDLPQKDDPRVLC